MKSILYIFCNAAGAIRAFQVPCQQNESDAKNLELFAPENLRGGARHRFNTHVRLGWNLSNWHVITLPNPNPYKPLQNTCA